MRCSRALSSRPLPRGSGELDRDELAAAMELLGQKLSKEQLDELVADIDNDGDCKISFSEFAMMLTRKLLNPLTGLRWERVEGVLPAEPNDSSKHSGTVWHLSLIHI